MLLERVIEMSQNRTEFEKVIRNDPNAAIAILEKDVDLFETQETSIEDIVSEPDIINSPDFYVNSGYAQLTDFFRRYKFLTERLNISTSISGEQLNHMWSKFMDVSKLKLDSLLDEMKKYDKSLLVIKGQGDKIMERVTEIDNIKDMLTGKEVISEDYRQEELEMVLLDIKAEVKTYLMTATKSTAGIGYNTIDVTKIDKRTFDVMIKVIKLDAPKYINEIMLDKSDKPINLNLCEGYRQEAEVIDKAYNLLLSEEKVDELDYQSTIEEINGMEVSLSGILFNAIYKEALSHTDKIENEIANCEKFDPETYRFAEELIGKIQGAYRLFKNILDRRDTEIVEEDKVESLIEMEVPLLAYIRRVEPNIFI